MSLPAAPRPDDPGGELQATLNEQAWMDGLLWSISDREMRARFEHETGEAFVPPPETPIEAMIDEAVGRHSVDVLEAFAEWWTDNVWGAEWAPEKWKEKRDGET